MENTARNLALAKVSYQVEECEVIELMPCEEESVFPVIDLVDEIDAWARQALAANGFGDY